MLRFRSSAILIMQVKEDATYVNAVNSQSNRGKERCHQSFGMSNNNPCFCLETEMEC